MCSREVALSRVGVGVRHTLGQPRSRAGFCLALALAGCYDPTPEARCSVACSPAFGCPSGLACNQATNVCEPTGGGGCGERDAAIDAEPGGCYGEGYLRVCIPGNFQLRSERLLSATNIDTSGDDCDWVESNGSVCVVAAKTIHIQAGGVVGVGTRPLALLGTSSILVEGVAYVASINGVIGAGSNPNACRSENGSDSTTVAGGGAGGSFLQFGGAGGDGQQMGGIAVDLLVPGPTGGCGGGDGGKIPSSVGGKGGRGGGAIYFLSGGDLHFIEGALVNASGGQAGSADANCGGGGGGAGGFIGLDAPRIIFGNVASKISIYALGGGGGPGGGPATGNPAVGPGMPAPNATGNGGTGGGGTMAGAGMAGTSNLATGGGGGGGATGLIGYQGEIIGPENASVDPAMVPMRP